MLRDLHIRNLAVVEEGTVEFGAGFNVLSGETGAGKSIVVDSLALLSGARASSDMIRTGADSLTVTGIFEAPADEGDWRSSLDEAGIELEGGELVIRRVVNRNGRSRAFVNDRPVTLKLLADLTPPMLRIHGQREELGLVAPELQRTWLDRCGGPDGEEKLSATSAAYATYREAADRLSRLTGDDRERRERIGFLQFQLRELEGAGIVAGEEDKLRQQREVLRHSEAIQAALSGACEQMFEQEGAAYEQVTRSLRLLQGVEDWEPQARGWIEELEELRIRLGEMEGPLRRRSGEVEADPVRLNAIEDRLATLERLFRKHGSTTGELLARQEEISAELEELTGDETTLAALETETAQRLEEYRRAAGDLSAARREWSEILTRRVRGHLEGLALEKARFSVRLEPRRRAGSTLKIAGEAVEFSELGYDQVTFLFSPNPGEEMRPLAKVASGGELSRLYLAVQLASRDEGDGSRGSGAAPTLVFDEVDAGIGGAEAARLGAKLQQLARGGQVLAVTHQPQVASYADVHFKVAKAVRKGRTSTSLERLQEGRRVEEVARMLAGSEITETSLSHARELIAGAHA